MNGSGVSSGSGKGIASAVQRTIEEASSPDTTGKGKARQGISAGYLLEVASPPGGGKTALAVNVALTARLDEEDTVEVLIVGESVAEGQSRGECLTRPFGSQIPKEVSLLLD